MDESPPVASPEALDNAAPRLEGWPRKRLGFLAVAVIACVVHFYVAILFNDARTSVRTWVLNGGLFALVAIALAMLVAEWSRRWAAVMGVVSVGWVAAFTAFLVHVYRRLNG